jgi:hypothetical protein
VNSQTDCFPTLTAIHHRAGLIGALLIALMSSVQPSMADQASPQARTNHSSAYGSQTVTLKDGRHISVATLQQMAAGKEKDNLIDSLSDADYEKLDKYLDALKVEANTRSAEKDAELAAQQLRIDEKKAALAQIDAFHALLDELFSEQVPQTTPSEQYKSRAIIVTKVLSNSILANKHSPDTVSFLKGIELALSQGRNPFTTLSAASKAKLKAMLK